MMRAVALALVVLLAGCAEAPPPVDLGKAAPAEPVCAWLSTEAGELEPQACPPEVCRQSLGLGNATPRRLIVADCMGAVQFIGYGPKACASAPQATASGNAPRAPFHELPWKDAASRLAAAFGRTLTGNESTQSYIGWTEARWPTEDGHVRIVENEVVDEVRYVLVLGHLLGPDPRDDFREVREFVAPQDASFEVRVNDGRLRAEQVFIYPTYFGVHHVGLGGTIEMSGSDGKLEVAVAGLRDTARTSILLSESEAGAVAATWVSCYEPSLGPDRPEAYAYGGLYGGPTLGVVQDSLAWRVQVGFGDGGQDRCSGSYSAAVAVDAVTGAVLTIELAPLACIKLHRES